MSQPTTQSPRASDHTARVSLVLAWVLAAIVCVLGICAWGRDYGWHFTPFNSYQLFPLFGVLAFSIMWTHYMVAAGRDMAGVDRKVLSPYFRYTSYVVLVLLFLHPGLLIYQRFRDGFGLPPGSYESYVAPNLAWITLLGSVSLLVFLAFELHRWFGKKPWWHYVVDASDFAMLAIVYHGVRLGGQLQHGWFQIVWYFYAVTLTAVLIRKYYKRLA